MVDHMPLRCDYSESDVCPHCNRKGVLGARRMCTDAAQIVTPPKEPGIVRKVYSFCMAKSRWKKAGSPVRTPERVKELLTICQACPNLLGKGEVKQRCGKCGCPAPATSTTTP